MELALTPVVEFCVSKYRSRERSCPTVSSAENPQAWDIYWRACLKDAGIHNLEPFEMGSQLVPIRHVHEAHVLGALLHAELGDVEEWRAEFLSPLEGGYVLSAPEGQLKPACCGDLSNLEEWRRAAEHQSHDWAMVWIGHPWTNVSANADVLTFLHPTEEEPPVAPKALCQVPREALKDAVRAAAEAVAAFGERLRPRVAAMDPTMAVDDVLEVLLRGHASLG